MSLEIIYILPGFLAAAGLIVWHRKRRLGTQIKRWGQALIIAAFIYVIFNVVGQAWTLLPIELVGLAAYSGLAYLAWKHHPGWLALGWLLHVAWDTVVHPLEGASYMPAWYPGACLGFDVAVGVYLLWLIFNDSMKNVEMSE